MSCNSNATASITITDSKKFYSQILLPFEAVVHQCLSTTEILGDTSNQDSPSSIAFLTARSPSLIASLICVRVCLLGPRINRVTERGLLHFSMKVNFSSPYARSKRTPEHCRCRLEIKRTVIRCCYWLGCFNSLRNTEKIQKGG